MRQVNLYTASGIRAPRAAAGTAGYILEMKTEKGPVTLTKTAEILNGHEFSVTTEDHEYRAWLRNEVSRKE